MQHGGKYGLHLAAESANKETVETVLMHMERKSELIIDVDSTLINRVVQGVELIEPEPCHLNTYRY